VLVPKLLADGHRVRVIDTYWYGDHALAAVKRHPHLLEIKADIRDPEALDYALTGCTAVIHLACVSNDPSFELDEALSTSVNLHAFEPMVIAAKAAGVKRFVYASSSSVYGVSEQPDVTEDHPLVPLTLYNKYKGMCEPLLQRHTDATFTGVIFRPATVCGYAPRQRLDLSVNILTNLAYHKREITVFGGEQRRPNLHIQDMTDLYVQTLGWPAELIDGKVFNAGWQNLKIREIAELVKKEVGDEVRIVTSPTDDLRSYHVSSAKIKRELGWEPRRTVPDAVRELIAAFRAGLVPNSLTDPRYFNIRTMNAHLAGRKQVA
jgi:nucleoside-diphosphate-sugar epimerase